MKSSNFSFDSNSLLFKPENASSEIVSTKTLRCNSVRSIGFRVFWENLLTCLSGRKEPKIWRKRDRVGNWYFQVFDPSTRISSVLESEQEVRVWLEKRYYGDRRR
jgi:hypothetical protein